MSGGGKTQTATQQVQIPPEVMARYRQVNQRAEAVARQPFQPYSSDPNAFVAPLTQTQVAGMQNINQAAGMSQPYFNAAAGMTLGGAQGVGPLTQEQIGYYQNPYTQSVVGSTLAGLQQQQGQQLSQQQAEAIKGGAFGGDRAGIQRAQLMGQQNLATAQAIAPLYQQGYQQAVQTAAGQQGVLASDLQRQLAAGQQLGGLGAAGQQAALAGAQAQLGAGTAEQQTQQAGLQALYNQFLQERGYPFQVSQFLANIAMGTGALSGSTTATTQPAPFFSDEREKTNVQPLGEGMYAYDYIDDVRRAEEEGRPMPPKRVGPMAQDIEERAPGLVGEVGGHKVVGMAAGGAPPFNLRAPSMGSLQGLGGLQIASPPPAVGGANIPIMRSAAPPVLAPKATGVSLGTPTTNGKGGVSSSRYTPGDGLFGLFGGRGESMGGMVSEPGAYASGGSVVGPEDMRAILAAIGQPLEFYGGKGLYGGAAKGGAGSPGYVPQGQIATPKLITAGAAPRMAESGLSQAAETGAKIAGLAKMGQSALVGSEGVGGKKGSTGLIGSEGSLSGKGYISGLGGGQPSPTEPMRLASAPAADVERARDLALDTDQLGSLFAARGGFMRHNYDLGGSLPYATGEQGKDPLQEIGEDDDQKYEMLKPASPPPSSGGSGLSDIANIAKIGATIFAMSDERMKDNIEPVGELYDGQPIYRYNMKGSPQTQLGLMAQDVERNGHRDAVAGLGGVKMVDYKRATDVAAGLAGRNQAYRGGYQEGGLAEEDLPMLLAALQGGEPEERRAPGLAPVTMSDAEPMPLIRPRETDVERAPGLVVAAREPGGLPAEPPPSGVAPPLPAPRVVGAAPGMREPAPGVAPAPRAEAPDRETVIRDFLGPNEMVESGGRNVPNLAGRSSAFGPQQITEGTWRTIITRHPQLGLTMEDRFKPEAQALASPYHARDLANRFEERGLPVTRENLRMGWFLGEAGGPSFVAQMRERPDAPAYTLATPGAVRANPETFFKPDGSPRTAQEMYSMMATQINRAGGAPPPGVAGGQRPIGGIVPPEQIPSRSPISTLVGGMFGRDMKPETKQALMSENLWVPALAGIGSMLASKSPYLAGAVGEGLQGGTSAYTALQKQQSATDLEKSQSALTNIEAASKAIRYGTDGRPQAVLVSDGRGGTRWVPFYEVLNNPNAYNLSPATRAEMEEASRRSGAPIPAPPPAAGVTGQPTTGGTMQPATTGAGQPAVPAGVPAAAGTPENVIRAGAIEIPKEGAYSINVAPAREGPAASAIANTIRAAGGEGINLNNPRAVESFVSLTPQLAAKAETDKKNADEIVNRGRQLDRNITDLWQLASSINKISDDKFTAEGAGQEYRAALANMYNTAARLAGAPGAQIDVGSDVDAAQIIRKLQALSSPQMAQQSGFHASSIATAISNAMPSGNLTKEAANTIITTMLVDLQKDRDFNRYYSQYINRFGTPLGVYESFNREMGDRYDIEKQRLKEAMTGYNITDRDQSGRPVTRRESAVDVLRRDPNAARRFDERYNTPGLARYWRTN